MADGRSSSEFQGSCPCSSRSRARFGRRSAGRAHLALGLGAGVAGASSNLGARQAPRAHLPRTRLTTLWSRPPTLWSRPAWAHLSRTTMPASHPAPAPAPKGRRNSPPLRGQARPSARFLPPQRTAQAGPSTSGAHPGRGSRAVPAAQLPGRAPREASGIPAPGLRARIPGAGSSGKMERGRGSDVCRGGAGGLGAPAGWEDGAHSQSWTRDCSESGREGPPSSRRPEGAGRWW